MCLYPTIRRNKKYTSNKKNGGNIPAVNDQRVLYVPTGCGQCMECRAQTAREWRVRLLEDIKHHKNGIFMGFTFTPEELEKLTNEIKQKHKNLEGYELDNATATLAVRRFLERWRKEYKKSLRHWFITELGQTNTEHMHIHGIIWTDEPWEKVQKHWKYGKAWRGHREKNITARGVNYMIKYVHKTDKKHPNYKPKVLTSKGIGRDYLLSHNVRYNKYKEGETDETYTTSSGHKIALPIYWRNKIYSEEQREKLWIEKLDKQIRYVGGEKIDISKGEGTYYRTLQYYRAKNKRLGFGGDEVNWSKKQYENERRKLKIQEKINIAVERRKNNNNNNEK